MACDDSGATEETLKAVAICASVALTFALVLMFARKREHVWKPMLRRMYKRVGGKRKRRRRRREVEDTVLEAEQTCFGRMAANIQCQAIHAARFLVEQGKKRGANTMQILLGEPIRILIGFVQVATHLYGQLSSAFCLRWPAVLNTLLAAVSVLAFDPVTEARVPCWEFVDWDYYSKYSVAIVLPVVATLVVWPLWLLWSCCASSDRHGGAARGVFLKGIATFVLVNDLLYPTTTRRLLSYFDCRNVDNRPDRPMR